MLVDGDQEVLEFQDGQLKLKYLVQMEVDVDQAHDLEDEVGCALKVLEVGQELFHGKLENAHGGGDLCDSLEDGLEDNS